MKVDALNKEHAKYLNKYIKYVQGIMYNATDLANEGKYNEIHDLLGNVVRFANEFKTNIGKKEELSEWCYMIPNLMLYSSVGFLIGIKTRESKHLIDKAIDDLFKKTVTMTSVTSGIIEDLDELGKLNGILEKHIEDVNN
tara:strand:+ start:6304 stop:6723 length:420 start_codon:yes stop_codon:yes gene_type:complete